MQLGAGLIVKNTFYDFPSAGHETTMKRRSRSTGNAPMQGSLPIVRPVRTTLLENVDGRLESPHFFSSCDDQEDLRPVRTDLPGDGDGRPEVPCFFSCCNDQKVGHEKQDLSHIVGSSDMPPHLHTVAQLMPVRNFTRRVKRLPDSFEPVCSDRRRVEPVSRRVASEVSSMGGRSRPSNKMWALFQAAGNTQTVLKMACQNLSALDASDASSAIYFAVKHCGGNSSAATQLATSPHFACIMGYLSSQLENLQQPRSLVQLLWALGKLGMQGADVDAVMLHASKVLPRLLPQCCAQELTNSLWGLSKLTPVRQRVAEVEIGRAHV